MLNQWNKMGFLEFTISFKENPKYINWKVEFA